jgi:hypothetical protein
LIWKLEVPLSISSKMYDSNTTTHVKLFLGEEIRRFPLSDKSYAGLRNDLQRLGIDAKIPIKYQDEEGDWVTLASDVELNYALAHMAQGGVLRLRAGTAPAVATPAPMLGNSAPAPIPATAPAASAVPSPSAPPSSPPAQHPAFGRHMRGMFGHGRGMGRGGQGFRCRMGEDATEAARDKQAGAVARFVEHVTVPDGSELAAGAAFTKVFRFRNEGEAAWPVTAGLMFIAKARGDQMGAPGFVAVGRAVCPGETVDIAVPMVAPPQAGMYVGFWRLCESDGGRKFGQRARVMIKVTDGEASSGEDAPYAAMLAQLRIRGFVDAALNGRLLLRCKGDMDKVVAKLVRREAKQGRAKYPAHAV